MRGVGRDRGARRASDARVRRGARRRDRDGVPTASRLASARVRAPRDASGYGTAQPPHEPLRRRAPLDRHPRGRGTALAAGVAAPLVRRRLKLPPPVVTATAARPRRSRSASSSRARARATSRRASCRCGPTWPRTRCPTTTPRRSSAASASPTRCARPLHRPRHDADAAAPARARPPGRFRRWEKALVWSHWLWFAVPARHRRLPAAAPPRALPARRGADLRDVRPRPDRLLGGPDGAAVVRGQGRADGRRATPELRRMMVEYGEQFWGSGWEPSVRFPGRQSPGRHAVAALRHVRHGRPPARRDRPVAGAVGWAYAGTLGVALVYLGEHYVVDLAAGLALAEGDPPRPRRVAPLLAARVRRPCRRWRRGRAHDATEAASADPR